ncbi:MAG: cation:proton antiporter [Myxococcota bacterium]|nr:cation:proton antiporter [Myxococcota bacterium]
MQNISKLLLILAMAGLMQAVHSVAASTDHRLAGSAVTLGIGFVLIVSWGVSKLFAQAGLPKLTGYMATGILAGPFILAYLNDDVVVGLSQVNGIAVALIALTAGSEIDVRKMRPLLRAVGWISLIAVVGTAGLLWVTTFLIGGMFAFTRDMPTAEWAAISGVIGVVVASGSPAVVVAIRAETGADGALARTVLGVVVLADLVVILLFAIASSIATTIASGHVDIDETLRGLAWELFGSIGIGTVVGMLLAIALRLLRRGGADLFVLAVCLVAAEVGRRVHLDPLLLMLAAGMFVENAIGAGEKLRHAYEDASLPVFILFFTVVGASIRLDVLPLVMFPAVVLVLVRAAGLLVGTFVAARVAKAPEVVARYGGFGLLPQAGLANALAILVARTFPVYGEQIAALLLGIVALNAVLTPALFRVALVKSGEVGVAGEPAAQPAIAA